MQLADHLPSIHGTALAAAGSAPAAERVTERVAVSAAAGASRRELVAATVRLAMRVAPAPPFDRLDLPAREALALVRLAGLRVDEVAELLDDDVPAVKRRLSGALRALAAQQIAA